MRLRRARTGQIAVGFVVLMGLVLVALGLTVNVGQVAQVRASVSNASDASALAAASWMASGQNEAALIARKMWDSIIMVQAIYLVPFCPRTTFGDPATYGRNLWNSLWWNNYWVFRPVANNIMVASWALASREAYTAAMNNLLYRFPCEGGGTPYGDPMATDEELKLDQRRFEANPGVWYAVSKVWTNCLPDGDPKQLFHDASIIYETFPGAAPVLRMQGLASASGLEPGFYQYQPPIDANPPAEPFECRFDADGIIGGPIFPPPVLHPNPGGVDPVTSMKFWEVPLQSDMYPRFGADLFENVQVQDCGGVCGMEFVDLSDRQVAPRDISGGSGSVAMRVTHTISRSGTPSPDAWYNTAPWVPALPQVGANATAQYRAATGLDQVFMTDPQNASANLTGAE